MKYRVLEILFFGCTDTIMGENLTEDEADKLILELAKNNKDTTYRWYIKEIQK